MPGDIFYSDRIFNSEAMALTFYPRLVDQDASIGSETCRTAGVITVNLTLCKRVRTRKRETNMVVEHDNLADCTGVLQLKHRLLLYSQDHDIFAADSYLPSGLSVLNSIAGGSHTAQVPLLTASEAYST